MRSQLVAARPVVALLVLALAAVSFAQTQNHPHRLLGQTPRASAGPDINTVAGNGNGGYLGSGVPALQAELKLPSAVALDSAGNFYIADTQNQRIRRVSTAGVITTYAGNGSQNYAGDGEQADSASLNNPTAIAFDAQGNLYIADSGNNVIRKVTPAGIISTVAGNGTAGFSGDTAAATGAELWNPNGVAVDSKGDLYIADTDNCVIRMVNSKGIIATYAGVAPGSNRNWGGPCRYDAANGNESLNGGYNGDGAALSAELNLPQGIALDPAGDLYIADTQNSLVRVVSAKTGNLTTVAGSFPAGYTGDGGPALAAALNLPQSVALDASGNLYVADTNNQAIREVTASNQNINTVAGNGTAGFSGDTGLATSAELYFPAGVAVDASAEIYIADTDNNRIREVGAVSPSAATPAISQPSGTYATPLSVTLSDATPGAAIYYTTNGTTPATAVGGSTHLYTGTAIPVDAIGTTVVSAVATAQGLSESAVATATYMIVPEVLPPVFSPAGNTYTAAQTVAMGDSTPGATIHYTLDGSVPTASSPVYTGPIIVASDTTIQAIAVGPATDPEVSSLTWGDYVFAGTPTVLAYPATGIKTPAATLNAIVNTLGISGTYYFQYGTTAAALTNVTPAKGLGASANPVQVSAAITGIVSKTTYYFQVVVATKSGTSAGEILSFTAN